MKHNLISSQHFNTLRLTCFNFTYLDRMEGIDWKNDDQRLTWEKELDAWRKRRDKWTWWQTVIWVFQIFILQFIIIFFLYGKFALTLVFS